MDLSQIKQFFNDMNQSLGEVSSSTNNSLFRVDTAIRHLDKSLSTTNLLIGILIVIFIANLVFTIIQSRKQPK